MSVETEDKVELPQDALIDQLTASQQEALETIETAGQAVFEGLSRVQHEITEFVAERIRQDMEAQQDFLRCRTIDDVRRVQTEFFRTAMDQYSAEANKLMKLSGEIAVRTLERSRTNDS